LKLLILIRVLLHVQMKNDIFQLTKQGALNEIKHVSKIAGKS